jgi:hypothetical protein
MELIYIILFIVFFWLFIPFRLAVLHPFKTVYYGVTDFVRYVLHRDWRVLDGGVLNCYGAHFGGGKTLSMAHFVTELYSRKNNKKVWDRGRKKWVTQKIHVIANFDLKLIPYEKLESLSQVLACAKYNKMIDEENNTRTVTMVLIDEASVQLNSRNFKSNIDANFLNTLLTCRHYHINLWYSSQKFKLTDALMRSVTQRYINCNKIWRFMCLNVYNADEIEYASDPTMVKPIRRKGFFVRDKDYHSYDTLACVDALERSAREGDMMSEKEILELRGQLNPDNDSVNHRSFKLKRRKRK